MNSYRNKNLDQSDRFDAVKSQLERETAALIAERRTLQNKTDKRPQIRQILTESAALTPVAHERSQDNKTQEVINRLQEIIRLCKDEGTLTNQQMTQVIKVENEVLSFLQKSGQPEPKTLKPLSETLQLQGEKSNVRVEQTWGKELSKTHKNGPLSEDTLEMISLIEKKALGEIIHLQKQRDSIKAQRDQLLIELNRFSGQPPKGSSEVDRLRQQNRLLREQNSALYDRLQTFGQRPQLTESYNEVNKEGLARGQYDSQIAVYENQLRRASAVINQLRSRLANIPGLEELHEQGERIRRETTELLQLKGSARDYELVRELQQRLEDQQRYKMDFLEEIKVFKKRFTELEEENRALKRGKVSFDNPSRPPNSPQRESGVTRSIIKKKKSGFGDYQNTLNQMRQALQ